MTCLHILCIHTFHCVTLQHFTLDTYIIWYVMLWYDIKQCSQANHYAKQHDYPKGPSLIWCAFFFAGVGQQNGSTPTKNETWGCKQHNIGNKLSKKKLQPTLGLMVLRRPTLGWGYAKARGSSSRSIIDMAMNWGNWVLFHPDYLYFYSCWNLLSRDVTLGSLGKHPHF